MATGKRKNLQALPPVFQTDDPVQLLELFRVVWLRGRYGGGKTSLGVWLTAQLLETRRARHVVSNIVLTIDHLDVVKTINKQTLINELNALYDLARESDDVTSLACEYVDCVFLLDEAWEFFSDDASPQLRNTMLAYPRKLNQYLILPSFRRLHKSVWYFTVSRAVNFRAAVGLPLWWYSLETRDGEAAVKTSYFWWFPNRVFKLYDTRALTRDVFYVYRYNPPRAARQKIKKERDKLNLAAFVPNFILLLAGVWVLWIAWQILNPPASASLPSHDVYLPLILNQ